MLASVMMIVMLIDHFDHGNENEDYEDDDNECRSSGKIVVFYPGRFNNKVKPGTQKQSLVRNGACD